MVTPYPCQCGSTLNVSPGCIRACCIEAARTEAFAAAAAASDLILDEDGEVIGITAVAMADRPASEGETCPCGLYIHPSRVNPEAIHIAACPYAYLGVSSDILTPDLDEKETPPMTDTTTPTLPEPLTMRITRDGFTTTYTARKAIDNELLLDQCSYNPTLTPFVQKARKSEATAVLGLFLEAVAFTSSGKPFNHLRFFIVGPHIYVYNRAAGDTRANWKMRTEASLLAALQLVQAAIDKPSVKMFGHPVLVELTADDLSAIESGALPPARFRGVYRIERDFGRYDFEMDVVSKPIPNKLIKHLTAASFASVTKDDDDDEAGPV